MSEIPDGATHVYRSLVSKHQGYYKFEGGFAYQWLQDLGIWLKAGFESEFKPCLHQLEHVSAEKEVTTKQELIEALEDLLEAEGVLSIAVAERKARLAIAKAKGEGK